MWTLLTWSSRPACTCWWCRRARREWGTTPAPTHGPQELHSCHHWCSLWRPTTEMRAMFTMYCIMYILYTVPLLPGEHQSSQARMHAVSDVLLSYGAFTVRNGLTWGLSETYLAQCRMRRMASMLVSGKEALQANSERHLTASWKESMVAAKCFSNTFAGKWTEGGTDEIRDGRVEWDNDR